MNCHICQQSSRILRFTNNKTNVAVLTCIRCFEQEHEDSSKQTVLIAAAPTVLINDSLCLVRQQCSFDHDATFFEMGKIGEEFFLVASVSGVAFIQTKSQEEAVTNLNRLYDSMKNGLKDPEIEACFLSEFEQFVKACLSFFPSFKIAAEADNLKVLSGVTN